MALLRTFRGLQGVRQVSHVGHLTRAARCPRDAANVRGRDRPTTSEGIDMPKVPKHTVPNLPFYLSEPCPPWCTEGFHAIDQHRDDRWHYGTEHKITSTLATAVKM